MFDDDPRGSENELMRELGHVKRPTSTRPSDNTPRRAGPAPPRTPSSRQRPPITFQPRDSDDETDFEQPPAPQRPIHTTFASDNPFQISAADAVAKVSSLVKEAANLLWRIPEDFIFADDTRQAVDFIETRVASHDSAETPTKSPTLSTDPKVFTLLEAISVRLQSLEGLVPSPPKARTASYAAAASSVRPQPPPPPPIPKLAPSPTQRHHPCRLVFQLTDPPDPRNRLPPLEVCERINQDLVGAGAPDALRVVAARWNNKGNCIILVHEDQKATDLVPYAEHFAHHICGLSKWEAIPDQAWTRVLVHGVDTGKSRSTNMTFTPHSSSNLQDELYRSNPWLRQVKLGCPIRWLAKPDKVATKHHSTILLSFCNDTDAKDLTLHRRGLFAFGRFAQVSSYVETPTAQQCTRCWSFEHRVRTCTKSAVCRLCAQAHNDDQHLCPICPDPANKSGCQHLPVKCVNCEKDHPADFRHCFARLKRQGEYIKGVNDRSTVSGGRMTRTRKPKAASTKGAGIPPPAP